jgi:hypothetical protein
MPMQAAFATERTWRVTGEIEGGDKPILIAESCRSA